MITVRTQVRHGRHCLGVSRAADTGNNTLFQPPSRTELCASVLVLPRRHPRGTYKSTRPHEVTQTFLTEDGVSPPMASNPPIQTRVQSQKNPRQARRLKPTNTAATTARALLFPRRGSGIEADQSLPLRRECYLECALVPPEHEADASRRQVSPPLGALKSMTPWLRFVFALVITTHMKNGQSGREMMRWYDAFRLKSLSRHSRHLAQCTSRRCSGTD